MPSMRRRTAAGMCPTYPCLSSAPALSGSFSLSCSPNWVSNAQFWRKMWLFLNIHRLTSLTIGPWRFQNCVPEARWSDRGNPEFAATCRFVEEIHILHFFIWFSSWIRGSHEVSRSSTWDRKILMSHECISIHPTQDGVKVGSSFCKEGKIEERFFHCSILVGSDGARSTVRKLVGIDMKGERNLQNLVSVHFLSRDLGQYLLHERPGMLFFIFNPDAIGVLVAHDLNQGEFVLQVPYYSPQQKFEDFNLKVCEQIILKLVGRELADLQVLDIKPWAMHAEVAEKYVSFGGRVVLVGDAAHRFPPAGGFGMNTGIQDAHNLAWKISLILNSIASSSIMQTYETERRPIAISNTVLSVQNLKAAMSVPSALGLDPTVANSVHQIINSSVCSILPQSLQKFALEGIFSIGRAQVSEFILNDNNPIGSLRLARLKKIFDEGQSLQLQFPLEDLGFCYQKGALITEGGEDVLESVASGSPNRGCGAYFPSAKPGRRLPHMPIDALNGSSTKDGFSTLDLISGVEFILIIAPVQSSYTLARSSIKVAEEFKLPLKVCIIWPKGSSIQNVNSSEVVLEPWKNFIDVQEATRSLKSWWELCQMSSNGVILVRPDEHIAWKVESNSMNDSYLELKRVFSQILQLDEVDT
ncbi:4-methyl-5-nitrocatechol 5-monooxygenase-like isoform X2 [Zingiber officinale]|uniref:4-methyl-5-nitrocatechol 5-monooxygenase-like isoform X2 n=1 Tax=Zingiber officinale TaxID=94328 RepID=UPI001C4AA1C9|nr:4-methyl-5-nitrocatechol 5-monooxygenase-like isoform X2 [Zingiber officinale]